MKKKNNLKLITKKLLKTVEDGQKHFEDSV